MVMLDKQDYLNKAQDLLADKETYIFISGDPTNRLKNKLIHILRTIKVQVGLNDTSYIRLNPASMVPPPIFLVSSKSIMWHLLQAHCFQAGVPPHMGWQRSWPTSSDH